MVLRWDQPVDDDVASYRALRGVRQVDGTVRWVGFLGCSDSKEAGDSNADPLAMLCIQEPNGETYVYAVIARDIWGNEMSVTDPALVTVTATELDLTPSEATGPGTSPLSAWSGWTAAEGVNPVRWDCTGDACSGITEYRVSRWNLETRTYEPLGTVPTASGGTDYSYRDETQPLGSISYYRVVGVLADGTEAGTTYAYRIQPDLV